MKVAPSLRIARLLLVGAAFAPYGPVLYMARDSREPAAALPFLAVLAFGGAGFLAAAFEIGRRPRRAKLLAVASALAVAAVATLAAFGLGPR